MSKSKKRGPPEMQFVVQKQKEETLRELTIIEKKIKQLETFCDSPPCDNLSSVEKALLIKRLVGLYFYRDSIQSLVTYIREET
jgi:hypothetical protein